MKKIKRTECDFSCTELMCKTLDKAGVPPDGHWRSFILYLRDISEQEHRSTQQKKQFQQILLKLIQYKDYSPENFKALNYQVEQIINAPCLQLLEKTIKDSDKLLTEFHQVLGQRRGDMQTLETETINQVERGDEPELMIGALRMAFHKIIASMDKDINNLQALTSQDSLTGLHNRRSLDERLKKLVNQVRKDKISLSVIFLDIDHFKKFNDDYGHRIGDQALATVASIVIQSLQKIMAQDGGNYFSSRYGGEEFAVLLPDCHESKALNIAETIRKNMENYNFIIRNHQGEISQKNIQITASFGVAELHTAKLKEPFCEHLMDAADSAMYNAKKNGRNQVFCYSKNS
jgi:diguanylate cyclase (GGDEF)-like protein